MENSNYLTVGYAEKDKSRIGDISNRSLLVENLIYASQYPNSFLTYFTFVLLSIDFNKLPLNKHPNGYLYAKTTCLGIEFCLIIWTPGGCCSLLHDHQSSFNISQCLLGKLKVSFARCCNNKLEIIRSHFLDFSQHTTITFPYQIHQVENLSLADYAVSLHVYFPRMSN